MRVVAVISAKDDSSEMLEKPIVDLYGRLIIW